MIQTVLMMVTLIATLWCFLWSIAIDRRSTPRGGRRGSAASDKSPFEMSSPETYERRYGSKLPF